MAYSSASGSAMFSAEGVIRKTQAEMRDDAQGFTGLGNFAKNILVYGSLTAGQKSYALQSLDQASAQSLKKVS